MRGRWKLMIVRELSGDGRRFSALQRSLNRVSYKVLTAQLRELEADGVVWRCVYSEVPPRVEYGLTERGQALLPVLEGLHAWGAAAPPAVVAEE
ncbi:helix-turn-helix transcriptional regulator [Cyanobium sp. Aljojuca 7A6]|nr:helix-turn-helix transcriptional regulator [Cyanobium sp. La Preciosa 7G6]MCP9937987.1 helix-turn-helix transcriptional regulator [Cyanobium sp. Aljojuca 7A6]